MYVNQKKNVSFLLTGITIALLAASSGCRTGGFTQPDMGKLAFWKSENSIFASKTQKMPPPPARHFDPAPVNGESATQIASNDDNQTRFRNDITEMRAEIDAASKSLSNPIRQPYSDSTDAVSEFASNSRASFESETGNAKSKLDQFKGEVNSGLSSAQNDFQAAMSSTKDSLASTKNSVSNAITNNDFMPSGAVAKSANDMTQGWKDNLQLPTGIAETKNKIDQSLASVNTAIYDVNGKLANSKTSAVNQFKERVSSFQQDLTVPKMNAAAQASNDFQARIEDKIAQSKTLANEFGSNQLLPPSNSMATTNNGIGSTANQTQPELQMIQAQMEDAKRQIEELKQQIAMTNKAPSQGASTFSNPNPTGNSFAPVGSPGTRVAQLQAPGLGGQPGNQVAMSSNIGALSGRPTSTQSPLNPLRANEPFQPNTTQPAARPAEPSYPSTTHGQFAPRGNDFSGNFAPMAPPIGATPTTGGSAQVGFESSTNQSLVVTPNNSPAVSTSASKIENFVSDVDIPQAILTGSSSFAPGSVQPLRSGN